jgi:hypothetical protein
VPTLPLLERLAAALQWQLDIGFSAPHVH